MRKSFRFFSFLHKFYNDVAFARDILCLRVKCKQEKMGCDWTGQVANAEVGLTAII